jgi:spermidine synthase
METTRGDILHREEWNGDLVEVIENGDSRSLFFASQFLQSRITLDCPERLLLSYTRYMLLGLPALPAIRSILIIGIGAGALIHFCHHHFPESEIDAVDNSPRVIDLARGYFRLPENPQVRIHCGDGLDYLRNRAFGDRFDLILVDAFDHRGMAEGIYTRHFFEHCTDALNPDGMISCNLWSGEKQRLDDIRDNLSACFTGQIILPVPDRGNVVILGFRQPVPWHRFTLSRKRWQELEQRFDLDFRKMLKVIRRDNRNLLRRYFPFFN